MLSKSSTLILGLINNKPINAYEITKLLNIMNIKNWYNIADSTVYATIKTLENKKYIEGKIEKEGNMPDKKIFTITEKGQNILIETLKHSILNFDYDTTIFSIAAFFLSIFEKKEIIVLLNTRLDILEKYLDGISHQIEKMRKDDKSSLYLANIYRNKEIILAEKKGTTIILENIN